MVLLVEDDFRKILRDFTGEPGTDFVLNEGSARFILKPFRPSKSSYYTDDVTSSRFMVPGVRYRGSPWTTVFEDTQPSGHDPVIVYMQRRTERPFDAGKLKRECSRDFCKLKDLDALAEHAKIQSSTGNSTVWSFSNTDQTQVVQTPQHLYSKFDAVFKFDHDPCPLRPTTDAMVTPWGAMNYVNPPFRHAAAFAFRAVDENVARGCKSVLICPAVVGSRWREELAATGHVAGVIFLRSGITFEGYKTQMGMCLNLILIGDKASGTSPCFFWDPLSDKKRRFKSDERDVGAFLRRIDW